MKRNNLSLLNDVFFFKLISSYVVLNLGAPAKVGNRSLGRNDAPVLAVAVYFFIQEPKSLMIYQFFFEKKW